jgi:hypothetical protein
MYDTLGNRAMVRPDVSRGLYLEPAWQLDCIASTGLNYILGAAKSSCTANKPLLANCSIVPSDVSKTQGSSVIPELLRKNKPTVLCTTYPTTCPAAAAAAAALLCFAQSATNIDFLWEAFDR